MILARLTRAVREQNWFAVALEFVIVVCGVLLAFQISTWSNEADERAYARDILTRLHRELNSIGAARALGSDRRAERLQNLLDARAIVMGEVEIDTLTQDQCTAIAYSNYGVSGAPDALPSLDELMASGALESVRSDELRRVAMELSSKRSAVRTVGVQIANSTINLAVEYPGAVRQTLVPDPDEVGDGWDRSASCDLAAMRADSSFQAAFLSNTNAARIHEEFIYQFLDDAISTLREALEAELDIAAPAQPAEQAP